MEIALTICDGVLRISITIAKPTTTIASTQSIPENLSRSRPIDKVTSQCSLPRRSTPSGVLRSNRRRLHPRRLRPASSGLGPNDQVNVTVEHLQQGQQLIDRLAVVCLIEQAIQLRR